MTQSELYIAISIREADSLADAVEILKLYGDTAKSDAVRDEKEWLTQLLLASEDYEAVGRRHLKNRLRDII